MAAAARLWNPLPPSRGSRTLADFLAQKKIKAILTAYILFTVLSITKPYLFPGL